MLRPFYLLLFFFLLTFSACDNPRNYSLQELENNHYNQLQLRVQAALSSEEFEAIFKEFSALTIDQILARLSAKDLELHVASYGFYYLANSYAAAGDLDNALKYHQIAAKDYINPQSLLKLAEFNFFKEKNYPKAYEYLHQSLEVTVEITNNDYLHILSKNGKDKLQYMLDELERSGTKGEFDRDSLREKLKIELPPLLEQYRTMYGLGSRGTNPS